MAKQLLWSVIVVIAVASAAAANNYKMCVPHKIFEACQTLMHKSENTDVHIECVKARDRMDCLKVIKDRKADFMVVDPEDMYVAFKMQNQDFSVFSEIRTLEEPQAKFRYQGVMLVKKGLAVSSLKDLKGKKACYTGFGRNVGYTIPITKLTNAGVLKVPTDPNMAAVEKELTALTEFFSKGCLVGKYSPDVEYNAVLKKRYSSLCEMCENPTKCDYPDIYSGYEGAIRCLVENNGDVAFTKIIFINKYFGLPVGGKPSQTEARANPDDYEYLCEDGSRTPLTSQNPCSWASRPWQGYMGNEDVNQQLPGLQGRLKTLYEEGKKEEPEIAKQMLVDAKNLVVSKQTPVLPGLHLTESKYLDVIERSSVITDKVNFCVDDTEALEKCQIMKMAAFSRGIRPQFMCMVKTKEECAAAIQQGTADVAVFGGVDYLVGKNHQLKPILFEIFNQNDKMVAIANKNTPINVLKKATIKFDTSDPRSIDSALLFNDKKGTKVCPNELKSSEEGIVTIVNAKDLPKYKNKDLVCQDFSQKDFSEYQNCNFEFSLPKAVFVKKDLSGTKLDNFVHGFSLLSEKFGHNRPNEVVFELFGEYEHGFKNVIFDDRAEKIEPIGNSIPNNDVTHYLQLHCV